jgi:peptide methionine sulfoxide reductase msrA/msrB
MDWDKLSSLTPFVRSVALDKATEKPFSGRFTNSLHPGTYLCRRCGLPLWNTQQQFSSHCGWPSFDERLQNAIEETPDADGLRVEIVCTRCHSHLGHVFKNEGFTAKNHRDCVNSVMLDWVPVFDVQDTREIIIAGGCFWGIEYLMQQFPGVLLVESGYIGGHTENPDYQSVCYQQTGHYEAVRVLFDNAKTDTHKLYQYFFEIHDPCQVFGQGPDVGEQYRSAIFYYNQSQKNMAQDLIQQLQQLGYKVSTTLKPVTVFWPAESYHQNYYQKNQKQPYCHRYQKRFPD